MFLPEHNNKTTKQQSKTMEDPLNISIETEGVDTSYPVLPEGDYTMQITESAPKPNKREDGHNWTLKLVTTDPAVDTKGKPVSPGMAVTMQIALQPGPDATDPQGFKKGVAAAQDAISGTNESNRLKFNREYWESCVGRQVKAHLYVDEYPKGSGVFSNKVRKLKPLA